jgi:nicotinamide-nucleotide amidase
MEKGEEKRREGPPGERTLRTAEIIAVGSELLGTTRLDTNSLYITERLSGIGIVVRSKAVVGDDHDLIAQLCRQAMERADLVVTTGGLGPTDDDLTRDAVAAVTGRRMIEQPEIVERLIARFARRGWQMPAINRRQALLLEGAVLLDNPNGTAPGQYLDLDGQLLVLLPGPPRELQPMLNALCDGVLSDRCGAERTYRRTLFVTGRGESHVEEAVQPLYARWLGEDPPIETTILATPGQIELHLSLRAADRGSAEARLEEAQAAVVAALGPDVFSTDGRSMEEIVGALLRERRWTIAAAESCTGGLLLSRLTDVPGSSDYVAGGAVLYSNELKTALVHVPPDLIQQHGAVSEPVAAAMAKGIRQVTGANVCVGITGIAGPGGGTPEKPVGTVAVAVLAGDAPARVRTFSLPGGRAQVKFFATQGALDMVRRALGG